MRLLRLPEVLALHRRVLEQSGGTAGVRDLGAWKSAIEQPRASFGGDDLYPTLVEKASALAFSIVGNHPFVGASGQPAWLYPHNRFLFTEATPLPADRDVSQDVRAVLFVVGQEDADGDGRLTWLDPAVVALARPDGSGFEEVFSDVVELVSHELVGGDLLVLYASREGYHAASVSLEDFSVVRHGPLPLPGAGPTAGR